jgi:hypothetical protein
MQREGEIQVCMLARLRSLIHNRLHGMLSVAVPISVIVYTQNIRDNQYELDRVQFMVEALEIFLFTVTSTMVLWLVHSASYPICITDCFCV